MTRRVVKSRSVRAESVLSLMSDVDTMSGISCPSDERTKPNRKPVDNDEPICQPLEKIKDRWIVIEQIGIGTFGQVYKVLDKVNQQRWAMKVELNDCPEPTLRMDVTVSKLVTGKRHAPLFFGCGRTERFGYMLTQLLDRSLSYRRRLATDHKFSLVTAARIADQALEAVQDLHEVGYLHRDIKPANFATGMDEKCALVYMIDYGLARKYVDPEGCVYPPRSVCGFRGTVRYASLTTHRMQEMSRMDDLWSIFYMLIDMATGDLPWSAISSPKKVAAIKSAINLDDLCENVPKKWRLFGEYLNSTEYATVPNYEYLKKAVQANFEKEFFNCEQPFDWNEAASESTS